MDLQKSIIFMMRQEEATAVPMPMRWVHVVQAHSIKGIFGGGSVHRAIMVIGVLRPK